MKPYIIINARIHPGESNSSWVMHGIFQFFENSNNQIVNKILENVNLILIPMLNPDGVVSGNYRTSFSGKDLNRQLLDPDELIFPELYAIKNLIK